MNPNQSAEIKEHKEPEVINHVSPIVRPIIPSIQRNIVQPVGINHSALAEEKASESLGQHVSSHSIFTPIQQLNTAAEEKSFPIGNMGEVPRP